ncbi:MAG: hypothetical protein N4A49_01755 [Marinifilaceae bacterium]|jgi:hypothetical protein|nr:hypothetical protein [Marinifilaceae bacterium]
MGILNKIFTQGASNLVEKTGNVIDECISSEEEKGVLKERLGSVILTALTSLFNIHKEVLTVEMKGNFLQRSWRPILMLTFGFMLVCRWFGFADSNISTELEMEVLSILKIAIGGYVGGRSLEKIGGSLLKNVDINLLRRKDRKEAFK